MLKQYLTFVSLNSRDFGCDTFGLTLSLPLSTTVDILGCRKSVLVTSSVFDVSKVLMSAEACCNFCRDCPTSKMATEIVQWSILCKRCYCKVESQWMCSLVHFRSDWPKRRRLLGVPLPATTYHIPALLMAETVAVRPEPARLISF